MKVICFCIFLCFLLGIPGSGTTQTRLADSLLQLIYRAKEDEQKLEATLALCEEYKSLARDTLDYYAFYARELAAKIHNKHLKDQAELAVAYDYLRWGWIDSVLFTVEPLIQQNELSDNAERAIYFKASRLKALSYAAHSRYQEGLTVLYKIINDAEAYKDSLTLGENMNTIGSIALARNQPREALLWLSRALSFTTAATQFKSIKAAVFVNMAEAYSQLQRTDSANSNILKGIRLFKETENLFNLAVALQKQSSIFLAAGKLDEAEASLKELITLRKQSGDSAVFMDDNLSLIDFYLQTKQVDKAIQYCQAALVSGDLHGENGGNSRTFTNNINIRLEYYKALAKCYKLKGNDKLYQQTLEQIITAKDSFYEYNSAHAIAELQTQYEVQKKENTIIQQQLALTRKNNRFYTLLGIAFFTAVLSGVLFYDYRRREKFKLAALLEKEKLVAAQSVARAEENERKRIAADLHDNLGAHAASILSNLDLIIPAMEGQPGTTAIQELRNNSQAIVSQLNDTIWALKKDALSLTAISDRIKVFIQRIQASYPNTAVNVTEKIEQDFTLSPSHAFHLFRIAQEAINNALRHSRAKEITVTMESNAAQWKMTITDNGTGLLPGAAAGNGLLNMKERAKEAGWHIEWLPGKPAGTQVIIIATAN